ncbi:hypothetical protein ZYGR_0AD06940 [Zygosaccharomyces rouxii]|uniref:Arrestin C-terminal-like domain-containing protein n=1 Tax=Zygosaccharomyces rouxii TaxID=4956 RepID=A0A1Q3A790_ZYGRO|nr:hypothetical protein ZYGR_0AD06940 [Zygosaccharomyces rouxii]
MGICSETLKTLGFTKENQAKRARTRSSSLQSMLTTTSNESRSSCSSNEENGKKSHKLVKLKNLKNGGTTVKNDPGEYEYYYEPLEIFTNPFNTKCVSSDKGYSVELKVDTPPDKVVLLPDLPTQYSEVTSTRHSNSSSTTHLFENSSTSSVPNVRIASQSLTNGGVTVSGTIVVKSLNSQIPQRLRHQSVALKCFVEEYACFVDSNNPGSNNKTKQIKLLNKKNDADITHFLPSEEVRLDLTDMVDPESIDGNRWLQPHHTYELPFTFTIKPYEFPASVRTYFGSTHYRIESLTQVGNDEIDTSFLTDQIILKRVLPTTSNVKYESVQMQGDWNNEVNYDVSLSNKMIEMGSPFDVQIGLLRAISSQIRLETISISVSQTVAIPCMNSKTGKPLPTSYLKKNDIEIYRKEMQGASTSNNASSNTKMGGVLGQTKLNCVRRSSSGSNGARASLRDDVLQTHQLKDLVLNEGAAPWLRPFYCELSNTCDGRSRLKITHVINVRLKISNAGLDKQGLFDTHPTHLTFKIPVLLVDHDMTMNLWLPPYVEEIGRQEPDKSDTQHDKGSPSALVAADPSPPEYSSVM